MSYNLQRSTHFDSSESNAIQRDMALARQQTPQEDEDEGGEDDLERARRSR